MLDPFTLLLSVIVVSAVLFYTYWPDDDLPSKGLGA